MNIKVLENGIRLDKYLMNNTEYSRNYIQKLIDNDMILVNDKSVKASYLVKENDQIIINDILNEDMNVEPENIPLDIVYEDDYLMVVNKPSGMVVHPANGNYNHTSICSIFSILIK